jgi:hypothetical protein
MSLADLFEVAMFGIYRRRQQAGYKAGHFLQMVAHEGGLATAKRLINKTEPSIGYTHSYEEAGWI